MSNTEGTSYGLHRKEIPGWACGVIFLRIKNVREADLGMKHVRQFGQVCVFDTSNKNATFSWKKR